MAAQSTLHTGRKRPPVPDARRSTGSPTVRRRELGRMLRTLRNERDLTVEQVAAELLCSPSKVSRMETGQRGATQRDIRDLCDLYGVTDPAQRDHLMTLVREGKQQGWWQQSFTVPLKYPDYVGFEQEATALTVFHSSVVPGLVQTPDYTRALHESAWDRLDDSAIGERVEERSTRQKILAGDNPPRLEIIIDEAVLRRPMGGPVVMREQLSRLIKESERPNLTIQVLPYDVGAHPALESNFTILEFADEVPTVIYVEGLAGHMYLEHQQDVERYLLVRELLRSMALSPQESAKLVAKVRDSQIGELRCACNRLQSVANKWCTKSGLSDSPRCRWLVEARSALRRRRLANRDSTAPGVLSRTRVASPMIKLA
jgi:transcriptional regulator with XRE-family HTH domain